MISLSRVPPARPSDRREGERYLTLLRVGSVTVDGRRQLCLIRNVSCGGMMIRTYSEMEPGTRLSIEFKHGESVVGTARWVKDGDVGLMFDHVIDVFDLLEAAMNGPRPRMPRVEISATCWVRVDAVTHRTLALDISQGGLKVRSANPLRHRQQVNVTITGLSTLAGMVCWEDGDCFGIRFNEPVPLQMLIRWLKLHQQGSNMRAAG